MLLGEVRHGHHNLLIHRDGQHDPLVCLVGHQCLRNPRELRDLRDPQDPLDPRCTSTGKSTSASCSARFRV